MKLPSLISIAVFAAACTVRAPRDLGIRAVVSIRPDVRARVVTTVQPGVDASVRSNGPTNVRIDAHGDVGASGVVIVPPEPPPEPPRVIVPIRDAPVVEFFGISLEGAADIVFVLDCSGSMSELVAGQLATIPPPAPPGDAAGGVSVSDAPPDAPVSPPDGASDPAQPVTPAPPRPPTKIEVAQAELVDALRRLPAGTRTNVVFFNDELEAFAPAIVALDETGRSTAIEFVLEREPTGRTALAPAMRTAFLMNARRIVLLSDGLGNVGGTSAQVLRDAREAAKGGVRIDTIGLGRDQDAALLSELSEHSGGLYQPL